VRSTPIALRYNGTGWSEISTSLPFVAENSTAAFDPLIGKPVLFDGAETWAFDGQQWAKQSTVASPAIRRGSHMIYDYARQQIVLFGGESVAGGMLTDLWAFGFRTASGTRDACLAGQDSDGDGLIACGDPDCFGRCFPLCALADPANPPCDLSLPRCGDLICNPTLEGRDLCPMDCP
jgi:hypothetical protein